MMNRISMPIAALAIAALSACSGLPESGGQAADSARTSPPATASAGATPPSVVRELQSTSRDKPTPAAPETAQAETRGDEDEAAAASSDAPTVVAGDEEGLPGNELTPQLMFQLLAAEVAAQRQQQPAAVATYLSVARRTSDPRLARRAAELALSARMLPQATEAAELWLELAPGSRQAAITVETLWIASGQFERVEPRLRERLDAARREGTLPRTYASLERAFSQARDAEAALALLDRLSEPDLDQAIARMARAGAAHRAGDFGRAVQEAERALELDADNEAIARALAAYARGAPAASRERAFGVLERFLDGHPDALQVRFAYAQLLGSAERGDEARAQFERILAQRPDDPATLLSLSQIAYETGQKGQAEEYLKRYIALPEEQTDRRDAALLFLGQIAEEDKRHAQALDWYRRIGPGDQYLNAVVRRALIQGRDGRIDEARTLLHSVEPRSDGERMRLVVAESQLLREARRHDEAFEVLDAELERSPDNPDLLYDHGLAAERIGRMDVMERSMRRLMELQPDQAHAFNALGYSLADRNMRLQEALELIERAHSISPDDAYILDSLGWVHFRLGNLDKALGYLRRAYALRPEAEIATHLGEVLWVMGQVDEAMSMWRSARSHEPDNETLRATLARLNVAL